jgi:Zinc finger protein
LEIMEAPCALSTHQEAGYTVSLWLLDFNQRQKISTAQDGVIEAVDAFCVNDPYYLCPEVGEQLWIVFQDAYLSASAKITRGTDHCLPPGLFVGGVLIRLSGSLAG